MANAFITLTPDDALTAFDSDQHSSWYYGTVTINAGNYVTGGIGTSAASASIVWVVGDFPKVFTVTPKDVMFYSAKPTGSTIGGFGYLWNKANNSFVVMAAIAVVAGTGAQQQEFTGGQALPTNVTTDVIRFNARFLKSL